jgi:hypothetical protein
MVVSLKKGATSNIQSLIGSLTRNYFIIYHSYIHVGGKEINDKVSSINIKEKGYILMDDTFLKIQNRGKYDRNINIDNGFGEII